MLRRSSSKEIAMRAVCEGACKDVVSGGVGTLEATAN